MGGKGRQVSIKVGRRNHGIFRSIKDAEAGRNRGARRWKQTSRDNSICHLHRRMTVLLGANGWDSWQRGLQNQQHRLPFHFSDAPSKAKARPRKRKKGIYGRTYDDDADNDHNDNDNDNDVVIPAAQNGGGRG